MGKNSPLLMGEVLCLGLAFMAVLIATEMVNQGIKIDQNLLAEKYGLDFLAKPVQNYTVESSQFPIEFTARNDPAQVYRTDYIDFQEYVEYLKENFIKENMSQKELRTVEFDRSVVRQSIFNYFKPRLFIYNRRSPSDSAFNARWHHYSNIVIHKTLKDMII
eukprot:CAMPEP_0176348372 /NCGR_PEP_ID=MMETSP0126-20121128/7808_1 /TAXON_ID=141414 ORGANISM="Strombidinopsis acuminatum, Strain SPMC142" /NCGR_SAMPLE_ID=MMETSP0126 /ASSEMBLY_ACC=CAM_ASM_000229 /LENGTH=161 /DNA_ID=CAMNT_0017697115 /DNA_START=21 /DNA_END=506 /DNA_ORIENTATION=-